MTILSFDLNTSGLFCVKFPGEDSRNIIRSTRAMLMNFCIVNTPRCQILIWVCKVFCVFQLPFACEKVESTIMKMQKTSAFKHFSLPKYSKNWTA